MLILPITYCNGILQICLQESSAFQNGNYYEVIYRTIKRNLSEKDDDITNLTHSNLRMLLDILPDSGKVIKQTNI